MDSPFPGMNPFLEGVDWRSFHTDFITYVKAEINRRLPSSYVARTEVDVVISEDTDWEQPRIGDVTISGGPGGGGTAVAEPEADTFVTEYFEPEEYRHRWLEILDAKTKDVVTVIELLSPDNKRGRYNQHAEKRQEVLNSDASLVEIDLLRGGRRPPTIAPLPPCDYAVFISEAWSRPRLRVVTWNLLDRMPTVALPLRKGDDPVPLPLQETFERTFEEGLYERVLEYDAPCVPPLPEAALRLLTRREDTGADR